MIVGTLEERISCFLFAYRTTPTPHGSISSQTVDGAETQDSPGLGQTKVRERVINKQTRQRRPRSNGAGQSFTRGRPHLCSES